MAGPVDPFASTQKGPGDELVGSLVAEYRLTGLIGRGGMGSVYAAEHIRLGRVAAVKLLAPELSGDRKLLTRFFAEARAVASLQLPSVVDVIDLVEGERPAIIMELLRGQTLADALARGPMPPARVVELTRQILACLVTVHRRGVIHRDIKPSNIFLVDDGVRHDWVKLLDFGIAKFTDGARFGVTSTGSGAVIGTPQYMSPEQIEGRPVDARTDLYALGCVVYQMLVGAPPFVAPTLTALMSRHLLERPEPPSARRPGVSAPLDELVARCLEKRQEDRFPDASAALGCLGPAGVVARQAPRRTRRAAIAIAVGLIAGVGLAIAVAVAVAGGSGGAGAGPPAADAAAARAAAAPVDAGTAEMPHPCLGTWRRRPPPDLDYLDEVTIRELGSSCGTWRTTVSAHDCAGVVEDCRFTADGLSGRRRCKPADGGAWYEEKRTFEITCARTEATEAGVRPELATFTRQ